MACLADYMNMRIVLKGAARTLTYHRMVIRQKEANLRLRRKTLERGEARCFRRDTALYRGEAGGGNSGAVESMTRIALFC